MKHLLATKSTQKEESKKTPTSFSLEAKSPERATMHPVLRLQRAIGNQAVQNIVHGRARGQPLGASTHTFMEPRFGQDFSRIPTYTSTAGVIQTKLAINKPGDEYEREADQIADQVLAAPANLAASSGPPHIQRFIGQAPEPVDTAPASVDHVLSSPGRPLDPALRQDMEQRFDHDFSQVRVHSGSAAEQSARDTNAHAYTVGHNIVFGADQFAPGTHQGRWLIAHELTHVVQQSGADEIRVGQSNETRGLSPTALAVQHRTTGPRMQRSPAGDREDVVTIHWPDEDGEFFRRLIAAVARSRGFRGVDAAFTPFHDPAVDFYRAHAQHIKVGQRVKVHVSAFYNPRDPNNVTGLSRISVRLSEDDTSKKTAPATHAGTAPQGIPTVLPPKAMPSPPTASATKDTSIDTGPALRTMTSEVMQAYRRNISSIRLTITYDGKIVLPSSMQASNVQRQHEAGKVTLSEAHASAVIAQQIEKVVMFGPGEAEVELILDGGLTVRRWAFRKQGNKPAIRHALVPRVMSRGDSDVEAIVREIRGKEESIHKAGQWALKQADPFTLRNLPYLAAGIIIPWGVGYAIMNFDELGQLIQIQRFSEFGELLEDVEVTAEPMGSPTAIPPAEVPTPTVEPTVSIENVPDIAITTEGESTGVSVPKRGPGPGGRTRTFEPPKLDHRSQAGGLKAGGDMPKNGAERNLAVESWTRQELEEAEQDLEQSIAARQVEQKQLGETSLGPEGQQKGAPHRERIEQEIDLLRAIRKKLSGT